eukprot:TRINITY_DN9696_c0_g1_i1.p1 TRINITY_DN9696_c0_g1~~TRINITY_DN9696_c0_g1_i1.p1  ORF type:complete len:209 (+),score=25.68 TRINITY_DN9696_c0_g1_i1:42-668(+)
MPYIPPEDRLLATFTTVLTNLSLVPVIFSSFRQKKYVHSVIFVFTFFTSLFYHMSEVIVSTHVLGMTGGQWHRIDTVCSILNFQLISLYFADFKDKNIEGAIRWGLLLFALICQEKSPWEVIYTIIPIVAAVLVMVIKLSLERRAPVVNTRRITWAGLFGVIALYFFAVGLDDKNDWLRLNHGMWHTFAGLSLFFALQSKETSRPHAV